MVASWCFGLGVERTVRVIISMEPGIENDVLHLICSTGIIQLTEPKHVKSVVPVDVEKEMEHYKTLLNGIRELYKKLTSAEPSIVDMREIGEYLDIAKIERDMEYLNNRYREIMRGKHIEISIEEIDKVDFAIIEKLIEENYELFEKREEKLKEFVEEFVPKADRLYTALRYLQGIADLKKKFVVYSEKENRMFMEGWVPRSKKKRLEGMLRQISDDYGKEVSVRYVKIKHEEAPVLITPSKILRPFTSIIKQQGDPSHSEVDPTPIVALLWIMMFGIMFPDFGQGIVLIIMGLIFYRMKTIFGFSGRSVGILLILCGIAATISGLLVGEFFLIETEPMLPGLEPGWSTNTKYILFMLKMAIFFGIVQIMIGLVLGLANNLRSGEISEAIFGGRGVAGIILFIGIIVFACNFLDVSIIPGISIVNRSPVKIGFTVASGALNGVFIMIMGGILLRLLPRVIGKIRLSTKLRGILDIAIKAMLIILIVLGLVMLALNMAYTPSTLGPPLVDKTPIEIGLECTIGLLGGAAMILVGTVMILLLPFVSEELTFVDGIGEILERFLSFISNILSYARIFGFALVHLMLGYAATEILHANIGTGIKWFFLGLFNFIALTIELIVVTIQSTRLILYEFMTKFYHGTGTLFRPTKIIIG